MLSFIIKRLLQSIPVIVGVSLIVFIGMHVVPGDVAQMILGDKATPEALAKLRVQLGLNEPLWVQYWNFFSHAVRGDFGTSLRTQDPVWQDILTAFPVTVQLAVSALLLSIVVGIPVGVFAAIKQNSIFDNVAMIGVLVGISMPVFWIGLILMIFIGVDLNLLPISGLMNTDIVVPKITGLVLVDSLLEGNFNGFGDIIQHLILPTITLATIPTAVIARITRSEMLEALKQDYVRTAYAKGLKVSLITFYHALKNALIPVMTVTGMQFGALLGGAILTETVFGLPGLGRLAVDSILYRDYPTVQGIVIVSSIVFILVNLVVDVLYSIVDPRIHYGKGEET